MADEPQGPATIPEGQPAAISPQEPTAAAPDGTAGQAPQVAPQTPGQATSAPAAPEESTFFDPTALSPELQPAYKQMQAAFTKKMQGLSTEKQKVEAYDAFMRDPAGELRRLATQYGINLNQPQGQAQQTMPNQDWQPQTWDDVFTRAKKEARDEILSELSPYFQNVQKMRAESIETKLAEIDPLWQNYEDKMRGTLARHPTLVNDVAELYKLSVPDEVLQSRATQQALKRLEDKTKAAQVADKGPTSRSAPAPRKASSFQEAVEIAKEQLAQQGR